MRPKGGPRARCRSDCGKCVTIVRDIGKVGVDDMGSLKIKLDPLCIRSPQTRKHGGGITACRADNTLG